MPVEKPAADRSKPLGDGLPRSDPQAIPRGKEYNLALHFNKRRPGIAAFSWVAVWRVSRGQASRAFPLDAHGFAEALQGAATTIMLETGTAVPEDELEIAGYKERRVNEYLRLLALRRATATACTSMRSAEEEAFAQELNYRGTDEGWPFPPPGSATANFAQAPHPVPDP